MDGEADHGGGAVGPEAQPLYVQGMDGEHIPVKTMPGRGAGPPISLDAIVRAALHGTDRQAGHSKGARSRGKTPHIGRQVEHQPMPPPTTGRRVGVEQGDGETLGARGWMHPAQRRAEVAPGATETVEDLILGGLSAEVGTAQGEGGAHGRC